MLGYKVGSANYSSLEPCSTLTHSVTLQCEATRQKIYLLEFSFALAFGGLGVSGLGQIMLF